MTLRHMHTAHDRRRPRRPHGLARPGRSLARRQGQGRLDRRHGPGLHLLLARRPRPSRLHDLEQTHVQRSPAAASRAHGAPATPCRHEILGNTAFDAYKADTLRRLEEEQDAFEAFLQRLREAKDKAEFDQFMDDRAQPARDNGDETGRRRLSPDCAPPGRTRGPRPAACHPKDTTDVRRLSDTIGLCPTPNCSADFYAGVPTKRLLAWVVDTVADRAFWPARRALHRLHRAVLLPAADAGRGLPLPLGHDLGGSATWGMRLMAIELRDAQRRAAATRCTAFLHTLGYTVSLGLFPLQLISIGLMLTTPRGQGLTRPRARHRGAQPRGADAAARICRDSGLGAAGLALLSFRS